MSGKWFRNRGRAGQIFQVMQKDAKYAVYYDIIYANENKSTERR